MDLHDSAQVTLNKVMYLTRLVTYVQQTFKKGTHDCRVSSRVVSLKVIVWFRRLSDWRRQRRWLQLAVSWPQASLPWICYYIVTHLEGLNSLLSDRFLVTHYITCYLKNYIKYYPFCSLRWEFFNGYVATLLHIKIAICIMQ